MTRLDSSMHPLLTAHILTLLSQRKIFTIQNFLSEPVEKLIAMTKLSFKNTLQIKTSLLNKFAPPIVQGAELALSDSTFRATVSSGISGLDSLLQGGFRPGSIYEVCSPAGEGKTQLCHTVAALMKHPVYYLDSKGDFSAMRIYQINSKDKQATLSRIHTICIDSLLHMIQVLYDLIYRFESSPCQETRLIIIDSVPTHFYALLGTSYNSQGYLSQIGNLLKYVSHKYHCIVLTTNLLSLASEPHEEDRPGMGKYWNFIPHVRIKLVQSGDRHVLSVLQTNSRRVRVNHTEAVSISLRGVH